MDLYAVKAFTRAGRDYRTDERFSVPPVIAAILVHEGLARFAEVGDAWPPVMPSTPKTADIRELAGPASPAGRVLAPPDPDPEPAPVPARRRRRKTAVAEAE